MKTSPLKFASLFVLILLTVCYHHVSAQIIQVGFKAGGLVNRARIDDKYFPDTVSTGFKPGYSAGLVLAFKLRNRYFLHTEYLYTIKSKSNTGKVDPYLKDKTTYHYFEVPILFAMHFKADLGNSRSFKWYAGAGPNIAYLLSGKGSIESGQLIEGNLSPLRYTVKFKSRPEETVIQDIYYPKTNRTQFGINLGAGLVFEPAPRHKVMVDLRYTFDQTLFGKGSADYQLPNDYNDNLRFRNRTLRASLMYLFEYNMNKKERHMGKTRIKG